MHRAVIGIFIVSLEPDDLSIHSVFFYVELDADLEGKVFAKWNSFDCVSVFSFEDEVSDTESSDN